MKILIKKYGAVALLLFTTNIHAQVPQLLSAIAKQTDSANPLEQLYITNVAGKSVTVTDGAGKEYFRAAGKPVIAFTVGGALGKHHVSVTGNDNVRKEIFSFNVTAAS